MSTLSPAQSPSHAQQAGATTEIEKLTLTIAGGIAFGYAASLAMMLKMHTWIVDGSGHPIMDDFVAFWSAGHKVLSGAALSAYDPRLEHAAEVATVGHNFGGSLGWTYPPPFLFVVAALASLPYTVAFVLWISSTVALHAGVAAAIARNRIAFAVACAAPWTLTALTPGQNGFLTASLIGLALLNLEKRPALAGLFVGLLSYKPQFGILFPLALACGGYWRAFAYSCASTLAVNGIASAVFGFDTFAAFVHTLSGTTQSHLTNAGIGWNKLQSLYGLTRALGASLAVAWTSQIILSVGGALVVAISWRRPLPFALKAASLTAAIPLVTPYIFVYDLPILAMAVAFLYRHRRFDTVELALLAATAPAVYAFLWLPMPSAVFASIFVGTMVVRRIYCERANARQFSAAENAGVASLA